MKKLLSILLSIVLLTSLASVSFADEALSGNLVYYSSWNPTESQATVLTAAAEEFMQLNPGVKIEFVFSGRDLTKTLRTLVENGTQVDMFDMNADNIMSTFPDLCAPVNEYLDDVYPTTEGKPYNECVMSAFLDLAASVGGGNVHYVPYIPQSQMFFYNREIFEEVGVTAPKTWNDFLAVCEAIKQAGYIPLTEDSTRALSMLGYHINRVKGKEFAMQLVKDPSLWSDEGVVRVLNDYKELADKGYFADNVLTNQNPAAMQEMVLGGQIAMFLNGTWMPNETKASNPDFKWGAFAYPAVENGVDGTESTAFGSYGIVTTNLCKSPDAAFAFAAFVTTGKYDQMFCDVTQSIPMGVDASWPANLSDVKVVLDATTNRYLAHLEIRQGNETEIINSAFINLIGGEYTVDEFLAAVQGK